MQFDNNNKPLIIIGFLISIFFLWFSFKETNWSSFILTLQTVNYYLLIGAVALLIGSVWIRAIRWRYLLSPVGDTTNIESYKASMIGYMGNNIFPLKMGEILKAYAISRNPEIIFSGAISSIIVERIVDTVSFLLLISIIFFIIPITKLTQTIAAIGMGIVIAFIFLLLFLSKIEVRFKDWYLSLQNILNENNKESFGKHVTGFCHGIEGLWQNPKPGLTIFLSIIIWIIYFLFTLLCIAAFDFNINLTEVVKGTLLILTFTTLIVLIPSAPGTIGTYQIATIAALQIIQINMDAARAFAVVFFLVQYIPLTIIGYYYFIKLNLSISNINEKSCNMNS